MNSRAHRTEQIREISWLADQLFVSQEGLFSMKLFMIEPMTGSVHMVQVNRKDIVANSGTLTAFAFRFESSLKICRVLRTWDRRIARFSCLRRMNPVFKGTLTIWLCYSRSGTQAQVAWTRHISQLRHKYRSTVQIKEMSFENFSELLVTTPDDNNHMNIVSNIGWLVCLLIVILWCWYYIG